MAEQTPQLEDSQPILAPQNVESGAESYDAFAKTLGALAEKTENKAEDIVSEQSKSMYINSIANIEQLKTTAQMRLIENPDQAQKITDQNAEAMDMVKQASFVNKGDRTKLNAYISGAIDDVALKGTETRVKQGQLQAAFTHYANWPEQLKAYQQALLSDPDHAENLKDAMIANLHNLVSIRAITPEQAGSSIKTMQGVVEIAQDHYSMFGNPNTTARDYHTVTSNALNKGNDNTGQPINQSTGWLINYHNNDKSLQGVLSDINNRMLPNPEAFDSLPPNERQHAIMAMQGTQIADGYINSGEPYPVIQNMHERLSEKGRVLNYRDEATRNALGLYLNQLKNGNYLDTIGQTPAGNAIMRDFVQRNSAIQNSPIDPQQKAVQLLQNKNNLVNQAVSYGEAHHIPSDYIRPVPQADVAEVEGAFKLGQDPTTVLNIVGQYSKQNQAWLANSMKNPEQRMIVQSMTLSGNEIKPQDKLDFIAANQTGRNYLGKEVGADEKDKTMMNRIYSNLSPAMKMIGTNYNYEDAQALQNAMLTTTLKYAKYLAQKDNNLLMENKGFLSWGSQANKYIDQASKIYAASFQQMSGTIWMVNPQQLPQPLSHSDLDILADHVTNEGYKYLKAGRSDAEYDSAISRNPLHMVISPTNNLQAVDGNGKIYYSMPFTTNTIPYARESKMRREAEMRKMNLQAYEQNVKTQLNVRLPEDANAQ
jgi:hypothetical protein